MDEAGILRRYMNARGLKQTRQRAVILDTFLRSERHFTVKELHREVRRVAPEVSQPTVFRTMKLLSRAGLARTLRLEDKSVRYEHEYRHELHGHLICEQCGRISEVSVPGMEQLLGRLCRPARFVLRRHCLEIFGTCAFCRPGANRQGKNERMEKKLSELKPGEQGQIIGITGGTRIVRRLMDMGVTVGVMVALNRVAPLGDPLEIVVRGYHLTLRLAEARLILVRTGQPGAGGVNGAPVPRCGPAGLRWCRRWRRRSDCSAGLFSVLFRRTPPTMVVR